MGRAYTLHKDDAILQYSLIDRSVLIVMAKVKNSGTWLIPDGFYFLDPLEELSLLGNILFHTMSV